MTPSPANGGRLQVLLAVEEGWAAFCRAPWTFLLFQALASVILLPFVLLAAVGAGRLGQVPELAGVQPGGAWLALIVGGLGYGVVLLWALVGLTRGAWLALDGRRPGFRDFTRWSGAAAGRLLSSALLLAIIAVLGAGLAAALAAGLASLQGALALVPAIAAGVFFLWLAITQKFLLQVSLLNSDSPLHTLRCGIRVVQPSWWMVLWLALVEAVIQMIGALFSYAGLLVLVPTLLCISTAAYRQLFGTEDRTGLLS